MRRITHAALVAACAALPMVAFAPPASAAADVAAGHVYVLNNNVGRANSITVFDRTVHGSLTRPRTTAIGGQGSVAAFADGTQGSLILSHDKTLLFAVDAGSNQISTARVRGGQVSPVGVFASRGAGPVSLTTRGQLLYVLNAANASPAAANVSGFRVDRAGRLHHIAGSTRPLSAAHPNPAQVQIDPSGHFLLVTEKGTSLIDVYRIHHGGRLGPPTTVPSVGAVPFGMAFDRATRHHLVVADAAGGPGGTGAATAYRLAGGELRLIDGPVPDHQIAPCWMVITSDGRFAYTSNADSHSISGYRIHHSGAISLLDANGVTAATPADTFPLEEALSRGSRFLYVLDSRLLLTPPGPVTLSGFRIHHDGGLTSVVDEAQITLPFSAIGLAAA